METLIGIQFNDFVLLAADKMNAFSIIVVKNDCNKIHKLNDHLLMATSGEPGDAVQFSEFIKKNIQLYRMRNDYEMSPTASATYVQRNLANYLRSRTPYNVNLLVAGYDVQTSEPHLYYLDYLATMAKVPYGMHGYGAYFVMGLMDRIYKPDATVEEGTEIMRECVAQIQKRLLINLSSFQVCLIDKKGITNLADIKVDPIKTQRKEKTEEARMDA